MVVSTDPMSNPSHSDLAYAVPTGEFRARSVRGGFASVLGQGFAFFLQIGSMIVLARLLTPVDYGLQGMVVTLTGFFGLFRDAGLSAASVQQEVVTHQQISTLFWLNLAVGLVLAIAVAGIGPFLGAFYREPALPSVAAVSGLAFFFNSLGVQHRALLNRAMRFVTLAKIDAIAATLSAAVGIGMAALGYGYWALVGQALMLPLASAVGVFAAMRWIPGLPARGSGIGNMVRFGGTITLNGVVMYVAYNIEKVLLGRAGGAASLGLYGRAYQLATLPVLQVIQAFGTVAFPALSRLQDDPERLRRSFLKSYSLVISVTLPAILLSAVFADEIVEGLLGPKWAGVPAILRYLSPTVIVLALANPFSWFFRSTGRVARSLYIALVMAPVVVLGVVAGLSEGATGVAIGYSTAMVVLAAPILVWAMYGTGITAAHYWQSIRPAVVSCTIAGLVAYGLKYQEIALPALPMLVLGVTVCFATYAGVLLFGMKQMPIYRGLFQELLRSREAGD
jgi:PST family polysaccharide transporter